MDPALWEPPLEHQRCLPARQKRVEDQRADAERKLADQRAQDELLEAEQGDPVYTLAQARTSTLILRLDAEHNESVTRFLINSGLAERSEASARLLREITLSHATLSDAYLPNADLTAGCVDVAPGIVET
jgi:hypothetical protein